MEKINERIRVLRETLDLTLRDFADRIGYTHPTIYQVEKGATKVERRLVVVLCSVFRVREEWLLEGTGEIFQSADAIAEGDLIAILRDKYTLPDVSVKILRGYLQLSPDDKQLLDALIQRMTAPKTEPEPKKNPAEPDDRCRYRR